MEERASHAAGAHRKCALVMRGVVAEGIGGGQGCLRVGLVPPGQVIAAERTT